MSPIPDKRENVGSLTIEMVEFKEEWQFEDPQTGVFYKNGIIPQKLFLTLLGGDIQPESAKKAIAALESMFKSGVLSNCAYIRIADYTKVINPKFLGVKSYNLLIFDKLQGFYVICTHVNHTKMLVLFGFS